MSLRSGDPNDKVKESRTGVLEKRCIFCKMERKSVNRKLQPLVTASSFDAQEKMKDYINRSGDNQMKLSLGNVSHDFISIEVHYHRHCKSKFFKEVERVEKSKSEGNIESVYEETFDSVQQSLLKGGQPITTAFFIHDIYLSMPGERCSSIRKTR